MSVTFRIAFDSLEISRTRLDVCIKFNLEIQQLMYQAGMRNITTIEWRNMTRYAQTADGVHFLTNVNYFKAQHVIRLADLMWKEEQYFYYDK